MERAVRSAVRLLPPHVVGAPFTYQNPLRAFEGCDFDTAVTEVARLYGAQPFLSEEAYHQALTAGRFHAEDIESILTLLPNAEICAGGIDRISLRRAMSAHIPRVFDARTIQWTLDETDFLLRFRKDSTLGHGSNGSRSEAGDVKALFEAVAERTVELTTDAPELSRPRDAILAATGVDVDEIVLPFFVRLLRSFTGIGQRWPMRGREHGLLAATQMWLAAEGLDSLPTSLKPLPSLLEAQAVEKDDSLGVAVKCTEALGIPTRYWNEFVCRKILALRGWAGLFAYLQRFADTTTTSHAPKYRLIDYLAMYLTVTVAAVKNVAPNPRGWRFMKDREEDPSKPRLVAVLETFDVAQIVGLSSTDVKLLPDRQFSRLRAEIGSFSGFERRRILHQAYERGRERRVLHSLMSAPRAPAHNEIRPFAQIVFCADDKQSLWRRQIDEDCVGLRTYGVPSFLGAASGSAVEFETEQRVDAVSRFISLIGLVSNSPSLTVLVGHPTFPENRAFDWTVHCGVCGGKCDVEHAGRLADWANDSAIHDRLKLRGVHLSPDTWFVAAQHLSRSRKIDILNRNSVPVFHLGALGKIETLLNEVKRSGVRRGQSHESRLRRWPIVGKVLERTAGVFVKPIAVYPSSIRAAGHPGCGLCLIGLDVASRAAPDHGAIMASYDATADPDGHLLAALMEELLPACSNVNLDYFFARTDVDQFGVGTAHSTESGEMKDLDADLRAGLPWSAVESHEPARLLVVVAATSEVVHRSLAISPRCSVLVNRNWVQLVCWPGHRASEVSPP